MTAPLLAVPTYRVRLEADQIGVDPLASLSPEGERIKVRGPRVNVRRYRSCVSRS